MVTREEFKKSVTGFSPIHGLEQRVAGQAFLSMEVKFCRGYCIVRDEDQFLWCVTQQGHNQSSSVLSPLLWLSFIPF